MSLKGTAWEPGPYSSAAAGELPFVTNGIIYAAQNGARAINISRSYEFFREDEPIAEQFAFDRNSNWGTNRRKFDAVQESIDGEVDALVGLDILIVKSAGNNGVDVVAEDGYYGWLQEQRHRDALGSNLLVVGALDAHADDRAQFDEFKSTNFGSGVDLYAPGQGIKTLQYAPTQPLTEHQQRCDFDGSSAAAPVVAGTAALLFSARPDLGVDEARNILLGTSGVTPSGWAIVDAGGAVDAALAP